MRSLATLALLVTVPACGKMSSSMEAVANPPGFDAQGFALTVIGTAADGLSQPTGLAFAPDHPDELWVVNRATDGVVIFHDPGTPQQRAEPRVDAYAQHFMANVSSISFGTDNHFGTCQDSRDEWNDHPQAADDYMGPTLWDATLSVFAEVGQAYPKATGALEGSHIDMLHESPLCMGIAHDHDNVFWAFDGLNGHVVRYDFVKDHGPGGASHSDGKVRRYPEAMVHRRDGVVSQLAFDAKSQMLYVADTAADRIMRLDTTSGSVGPVTLPKQMEALAEYAQVTGVDWQPVVPDVSTPSGLVLSDERMYVFSGACGQIVSYDRSGTELARMAVGSLGVSGMTIGPDGKIWFADELTNTVTRVDP